VTSVASFDDATTAGNYTLIFSGVRIPSSAWVPGAIGWVQNFTSSYERLTPINLRQNFTSTLVIQDGRFPAQTWEHEFLLYTEVPSLQTMAEVLYKLHDEIRDLPVPLTLNDGDTATEVVNFGDCYIEPASLDQPSELLLFRAGFIRVSFFGNTRPIVT
jgi:hypothetical protein